MPLQPPPQRRDIKIYLLGGVVVLFILTLAILSFTPEKPLTLPDANNDFFDIEEQANIALKSATEYHEKNPNDIVGSLKRFVDVKTRYSETNAGTAAQERILILEDMRFNPPTKNIDSSSQASLSLSRVVLNYVEQGSYRDAMKALSNAKSYDSLALDALKGSVRSAMRRELETVLTKVQLLKSDNRFDEARILLEQLSARIVDDSIKEEITAGIKYLEIEKQSK